jgi:signal transduction histidine kinase
MLLLAIYCTANVLGRFIDDFQLDPVDTTYVAIWIFGMFVIAIFFFGAEFAQSRTSTTRRMQQIGIVIGLVNSVALWSGRLFVDIRPTSANDGSYQGHWTTLGLIVALTLLAYMIATAIALYRMEDERGRSLWAAPVLVIAGIVSSTIIWPVIHIPLQAFFLALAALALGVPVLRYELFNPLAALNAELAQKNIELRKASRMKSQFLANMSHELRTPLNSIIGYAQLVMGGLYGALNDTQLDRLEKVIRNGQTLLKLINDVIDLNRIETGEVRLERRQVTTAEVLHGVLDTIEPLALHKGLFLKREFDGVPSVYADDTRLRQIVTNIAANAVKFTRRGGITVRAQLIDSLVQIEIEDTGIGIPADQFAAIFEEFQQVDASPTREYEGSGLGLTITRRLIEMHGGRIWLESAVGQGTTFYVTLPTQPPEEPAVPTPAPAAAAAVPQAA